MILTFCSVFFFFFSFSWTHLVSLNPQATEASDHKNKAVANALGISEGSSLMSQWVRDPALSLLWPQNFHMPRVWPKGLGGRRRISRLIIKGHILSSDTRRQQEFLLSLDKYIGFYFRGLKSYMLRINTMNSSFLKKAWKTDWILSFLDWTGLSAFTCVHKQNQGYRNISSSISVTIWIQFFFFLFLSF